MSNSYTNKRVWEIDSAEDINGTFLVDRFEFHPAAKNQTLDMEEANGDQIWVVRSIASASNDEAYGIESKVYSTPKKCRGIYIKTITDGTLYVELNKKSPLA